MPGVDSGDPANASRLRLTKLASAIAAFLLVWRRNRLAVVDSPGFIAAQQLVVSSY